MGIRPMEWGRAACQEEKEEAVRALDGETAEPQEVKASWQVRK